ncbi:MAG: VanW family protein [Clostridia bacterium]|nr:VanW family protein [Clostridia bacterium]
MLFNSKKAKDRGNKDVQNVSEKELQVNIINNDSNEVTLLNEEDFKNSINNNIPVIEPNIYKGGPGKRVKKGLIITLKIVLLLIVIELLFLTFYLGTNIKIFRGVSINGIDLSGLSKTEAEELLEKELTNEVVNKEVIFYYKDYERAYKLSDIIDSLDYKKIARTAQRIGREGNIFERFMTVVRARRESKEIDLKYSVDLTKLRAIIYEIKYDIDKEAKDASYTKKNGEDFVIEDETIGIELDVAKTIDTFRAIIEDNKIEDYDYKLEMIANDVEPKVKRIDIEAYSTLLSKFDTDYRRGDTDRTKKLEEACKKLNKYMLESDKEFSFNEVIGITPTKESCIDGVDQNDEVNVQLATTLYNAVILAGLEVTDRTNVDYLPEYIEIGRDALVYGKGVDFKFKNTTTNPIYIESYVNGGKCYVKIYGNENFKIYDSVTFKHNMTKVTLPEQTIEKEDESVEPGDKVTTQIGKSGCTCEIEVTYKSSIQPDKVVRLKDSVYLPTPTRISIGKALPKEELDEDDELDKDKNNKNEDQELDKQGNDKTDGQIKIGD